MNKQKKKIKLRSQRHKKVRAKIFGTKILPRIAVFKSHKHIYGQVIDDQGGKTLLSQSDFGISKKQLKVKELKLGEKEKSAFLAGQLLAEKMKEKKIIKAVFDRGGFKYHGRIRAFAQGLHSGGVKV